ncbi:hypothetical protein AB0G77_32510 [Streptomyces hygroscopicus]|uniref:hypothetical protein n=1 Tax=Streptomyces hygroscopicus TaxID=1912 RepID=UPI0033FBD130
MDLPDRLIALQRAADAEHEAQWKRWCEAATTVQAAVTEHARDAGLNRYELEAAVKRAGLSTTNRPLPARSREGAQRSA